MNSSPVLFGTNRERIAILFICSGEIAVLSLLVPHKTEG
jgi:hypothetical protein